MAGENGMKNAPKGVVDWQSESMKDKEQELIIIMK